MPGPHIRVQEDWLVNDELMGGLNDAPYGPPPHGLPLTISLTLTMNPNPHPYTCGYQKGWQFPRSGSSACS